MIKKIFYAILIFVILIIILKGFSVIRGAGNIHIQGDNNQVKNLVYVTNQIKEEKIDLKKKIRSPSILLPKKTIFIDRENEVQKIKEIFIKEQKSSVIPYAVLVGVGGSGKTTLSRYFSSICDVDYVWEINAESRASFIRSLMEFALTIAQTENSRKKLNWIIEESPNNIKEKLLICFISENIRDRKWLLLLDNVEDYKTVSEFFNIKKSEWGDGKIIITTTNHNIFNNNYVEENSRVSIEQIDESLKLELFLRINSTIDYQNLTLIDKENIAKFLEKIPSYPLDVTLCSYYLTNYGIGFDEYINILNKFDKSDSLLKTIVDSTQYDKTRYGIVASMIQKLAESSEKFKAAFLFITCIESQNIPVELLDRFLGQCTEFIKALTKIGALNLGDRLNVSSNKYISIHKIIHHEGLRFLSTNLNNQELEGYLNKVILVIEDYYNSLDEQKKSMEIISLAFHVSSFFEKIRDWDLDTKIKKMLELKLLILIGKIKGKWEIDIAESAKYLDRAINLDEEIKLMKTIEKAKILNSLSFSCVYTDKIDQAIEYAEYSLKLCNRKQGVCPYYVFVDNYRSIGIAFSKKGEFNKSLKYLQKALSIAKSVSDHSKPLIAEIYSQLAQLYVSNYLYRKEADVAGEYYISLLKLLGGTEIYHQKSFNLPDNISCGDAL